MTLITKRDIQATRSHHSRHTERRLCPYQQVRRSIIRHAQNVLFWVTPSTRCPHHRHARMFTPIAARFALVDTAVILDQDRRPAAVRRPS